MYFGMEGLYTSGRVGSVGMCVEVYSGRGREEQVDLCCLPVLMKRRVSSRNLRSRGRLHNRRSYPFRVVQHQILEFIIEHKAVFKGASTPPSRSLYPTAAWCDMWRSAGRLATTG